MHFSVSGVDTWVFIPPLVAFIVSFFTSMAGVSGAFLLLPFQMSVLHFTSPSVSATNFVFNIVAIPSGVYRYIREGRMAWPLAWVIIAGTLPGVFIGYYLRVLYLPDPRGFKLFVACVLLYIGGRLLYDLTQRAQRGKKAMKTLEEKFSEHARAVKAGRSARLSAGLPAEAVVKTVSYSFTRVVYRFWDQEFSFSTVGMFVLAFVVGVIGGTYGVGGGAMIAPFCVAVFQLPIYTVAGPSLMAALLTSVAGVFFYSVMPSQMGMPTAPDWLLGFLFGVGGFAGVYCGARLQKYFPQKFIQLMLGMIIVFLALSYVAPFFAA
ncbi:MAG: sulfite exporter TauE/SafE family protein [Deltaproteobacteria bacterium]|nr:sulfite exporter TauE/SafE family protein [Deltaproteobacteria bacterium]